MRLDFADIKQRVSILQVVELLGIKALAEHNDTLRGKCPLCDATNARGFVVNPQKGTWYCFGEKAGGDAIRLATRRLGATTQDGKPDDRAGAEHIAKHLLNGAGEARDNAGQPQEAAADRRKSPDFDPLKYLETLDASHEALQPLDIAPETFIHFKAGYCSKGLNRGRLAVAWHDAAGVVRVFIGVSFTNDVPMYLLPKGQPTPYWFNTHAVEDGAELRILPTVLDVMRAFENGVDNVICPLAPTGADAVTSLQSLAATKNLTVEF